MIYLDNAATTLIKPHSVINEVNQCMKKYCANSGRGGHKLTLKAGEKVYKCRENIAKLFKIKNPSDIAFTNNTTMAINMGIKGIIKRNDEIVIGGMEHNSVLRPAFLTGRFKIAKADENGIVSPEAVKKAITPNTKLIVINHASNITGAVSPIEEIGKIAYEKNIPFMVDCAQSGGTIDIDVNRDNISLLAFAGHKGLYGPTGTGGLYVSDKIQLKPIIQGGTGTMSESYFQPDFMPDMLESGTLNIVGIAGLSKGVEFVSDYTVNEIHKYEQSLINILKDSLLDMKNVTIYGGNGTGILSFLIKNKDSVEIAEELDSKFNIAVRGGLHCAVLAHESLNTKDTGLTRISVSVFNTKKDVKKAVDAIYKLSKV